MGTDDRRRPAGDTPLRDVGHDRARARPGFILVDVTHGHDDVGRQRAHSYGHEHAVPRAGSRYRGRLVAALALTAGFLVVQVVAAALTNSLALLSDAGHMLTDVAGLAMALAAIHLADRHEARHRAGSATSRHTFGLYRLEILAALLNAVLLVVIAGYVMFEAVRRFGDEPDVLAVPVIVVASIGLAVNLVAYALLRRGADESLNVKGAALEVLADAVGSLGVVAGATLVALFDWVWVDTAVAVAIGVWILPRTLRLGAQAVRILLQSAPPALDLHELEGALAALPDVIDVHDLHAWTLTSEMEAVSAHLMTTAGADPHATLDRARELVSVRFGIHHATFQVEPETHEGCAELHW